MIRIFGIFFSYFKCLLFLFPAWGGGIPLHFLLSAAIGNQAFFRLHLRLANGFLCDRADHDV